MLKKLQEQKLFIISFLLILSDQLTKLWIKGFTFLGIEHVGMPINTSKNIWGDFLQFTYVENPGMAFGVTFGDGKIFLSLFSIIAAAALAWFLYKLRHSSIWVQIGVMLLLSGAIGNLIDRVFYGVIFSESPLFYGKVVDFIDVDCPDFNLFGREITRWWIFNIADSCVSCGIVLLLIFNHKIPTFKGMKTIAPSSVDEQGSTVELVDYNPQWAVEFEELKSVLHQSLGSDIITIEHVGSTSVPGMVAKPIIDVDIVIADMQIFETVKSKLESLGYIYEGDKGIAQREAFRQRDNTVPHSQQRQWTTQHMYVCPSESIALQEHRSFRQALIENEELRDAYVQLKKELAERYKHDRESYTEMKTDYIKSVVSGNSNSELGTASEKDA